MRDKRIYTPTKYRCKNCKKKFIDDKFEKRKYCSLRCHYTYLKKIYLRQRIKRFKRNGYDWYGSSIILKQSGLVKVPKGKIPHHLDNNSKNNHKENLWFVTVRQNRLIHAWAYRFIVKEKLVKKYRRWLNENKEFIRSS